MKKISILAISVLAVGVLAGCTKSGTNNTSTVNTNSTTVNQTSTPTSLPSTEQEPVSFSGPLVNMDEYTFSPKNLELKVGVAQQVKISNTGSITHKYVVPDLDINVTLAGGKSEIITVTPQKAGTFEVVCSEPGHEGLGMVGTVTVK